MTSVGELEGSYCPHYDVYTQFLLRFVGYIDCYRQFQLTKRHTAIFSTQMALIYQYLSSSFREIYPDIFITVEIFFGYLTCLIAGFKLNNS